MGIADGTGKGSSRTIFVVIGLWTLSLIAVALLSDHAGHIRNCREVSAAYRALSPGVSKSQVEDAFHPRQHTVEFHLDNGWSVYSYPSCLRNHWLDSAPIQISIARLEDLPPAYDHYQYLFDEADVLLASVHNGEATSFRSNLGEIAGDNLQFYAAALARQGTQESGPGDTEKPEMSTQGGGG